MGGSCVPFAASASVPGEPSASYAACGARALAPVPGSLDSSGSPGSPGSAMALATGAPSVWAIPLWDDADGLLRSSSASSRSTPSAAAPVASVRLGAWVEVMVGVGRCASCILASLEA